MRIFYSLATEIQFFYSIFILVLILFFFNLKYVRYIPLPITGGATNVVEGTEAGKKKLDVWLPVGHRPTDPDDVSGELHLVVEFIPVSVFPPLLC